MTKFLFYETHMFSWFEEDFSFPNAVLNLKEADVKKFSKPLCDLIELPFSMQTFQHLEVILFKLENFQFNNVYIVDLKRAYNQK